jgi:tetratricopeptide (TPR) repeat protein
VHGLWLFSEIGDRYLDAGAAFEEAAAALEDNPSATDADDPTRFLARGRLIVHWGSFFARLGKHERAGALIDRGIDVLEQLGSPSDLGLAFNFRAMCAHARRDYHQEQWDLRESIRHFEAANDRWGLAYSINDLGMAIFLLGNAVEAEQLSQQSLQIFTNIGDKRGMGFALRNLGIITFGLGNHGEARRYLAECLVIRQSIGNRWGIADSLNQLGVVTRSTGDSEESLTCFLEALRVTVDIRAMALAIDVLTELAHLLTILGEPERAARIRDTACMNA